MSVDLNMVYFHILINEDTSKFCLIILLWEKYHYNRLPIEVSKS